MWSFSISVFFFWTNIQMLRTTLYSRRVDIPVVLFTHRMILLSSLWAANLYQILRKMKQLRFYFERVVRAEEILFRIGVAVNYDGTCYLYWTLVVLWLCSVVFFYSLIKGHYLQAVFRGIWLMASVTVMSLLQYQFFAAVLVMRSLLEAVETAITFNRTVKELELLAQVHSLVCGAGGKINSVYSLQLFCVQFYYFAAFCSFLWKIVSSVMKLMNGKEFNTEPLLLIYLSFVLISILYFYMAAFYCDTAQKSVIYSYLFNFKIKIYK